MGHAVSFRLSVPSRRVPSAGGLAGIITHLRFPGRFATQRPVEIRIVSKVRELRLAADLLDPAARLDGSSDPIDRLLFLFREARHDRRVVQDAGILLRKRKRLADLAAGAGGGARAREADGEP